MDKKPDYPAPMKGNTYEPEDRIDKNGKKVKKTNLPERVIVMPKLNGVRMRWDVTSQCLRTNNGNKVKSCDHIVKAIIDSRMNKLPLDGESYHHSPEYSFSFINGKTRRQQSSAETKFLQYHIFDMALDGSSYTKAERLEHLASLFKGLRLQPPLVRVPYCISTPDMAGQIFQATLSQRFEGVMIFDPAIPYTPGRSNRVWKHKPVFDAEFLFMGFEFVDEGRNVGTFGSIILQMPDGRSFTCAGISDEKKAKLLKNPPPKGTPMTIEFGDRSDTGVPIFPRLKDERWDQ